VLPACLARTPEKRENSHWFGGSYGESRLNSHQPFNSPVTQSLSGEALFYGDPIVLFKMATNKPLRILRNLNVEPVPAALAEQLAP
jgi:hypothetical protein